jgi:PilZ domain-containing protein
MHEWETNDRRSHPRQPVRFRASLTSAYATEEGMVLNLSRDGCRLKSSLAPSNGTQLVIHLHVADDLAAIRVDRAVVRWAAGPDFGVQFLLVGIYEAEQLQRVLNRPPSIGS